MKTRNIRTVNDRISERAQTAEIMHNFRLTAEEYLKNTQGKKYRPGSRINRKTAGVGIEPTSGKCP